MMVWFGMSLGILNGMSRMTGTMTTMTKCAKRWLTSSNKHGAGDEGWGSARWEVYDKVSVSLARRLG